MRRDHSGLYQHICTIRATSRDNSRIGDMKGENGRYSNMPNQVRKGSKMCKDNLNLTANANNNRIQSAVELNLGSAQSQLNSNKSTTGNTCNTISNPFSAKNKKNSYSKMSSLNLKYKNANEFFKKQRDDAKKAKADEYLSHCMKNTEETLGHVLSKIKTELSDISKTIPKAKSPSSRGIPKPNCKPKEKEKGRFNTMEHVSDTYEIEEIVNFSNSRHKNHEERFRKANSMLNNENSVVTYTSEITQQDKIISELSMRNETLDKQIHLLESQLSSIYEKYCPFKQNDFQYEVLKSYSLDNSKWLLVKRKGKEINGTATSNYYWALESDLSCGELENISTAGKSLNECEDNFEIMKDELMKKEKTFEKNCEIIKALESEVSRVKCENNVLKNTSEVDKATMTQEIVKSQEETSKLRWQNQNLMKEIDRMQKEINNIPNVINEEISKAKFLMNKTMKEGMNSKIGKLKQLLEQASNEKKLLEQKLIQSSIRNSFNVEHTIEIFLSSTKVSLKTKEVKELTQSAEKEKEKEKEKDSIIAYLKSQLSSLIVDNDRMRKVHKEVEKNFITSLNEKNSTIENLQDELKDITSSRDSIYNKLQDVENELNLHISHLNQEIANKEAQWKEQSDIMNHSHAVAVEQKQRVIDDLQKELEISKLETASSKKLVNDLKYLIEIKDTANNENYEKQIQDLKGKLQEQEKELEDFVTEKDHIISQLRKENDDISSKYKGMSIKIKEKDNQIQDCVNKIDWYQENFREQEIKLKDLEKKIEAAKIEHTRLIQESSICTEKLQKEIDYLYNDKIRATLDYERKFQEITNKKSILEEQLNKSVSLRNCGKAMAIDSTIKLSIYSLPSREYQNELEIQKCENETLKDELKMKISENIQLKEELITMEINIEEKENYEEEIKKYQIQIEGLKEIAISKEAEIQHLKAVMENYKEEMEKEREREKEKEQIK